MRIMSGYFSSIYMEGESSRCRLVRQRINFCRINWFQEITALGDNHGSPCSALITRLRCQRCTVVIEAAG